MAVQAGADAVAAASAAAGAAVADATSAASQVVHTGFALVVDRIDYVIMVPLLYVSIIALLAGIIWRIAVILRSPPPPYPLRLYPVPARPGLAALGDTFAMPQVRKHKPLFWVFLMIFHVGMVLLLILGHLDILPQVNILPADSRHMLGAGGRGDRGHGAAHVLPGAAPAVPAARHFGLFRLPPPASPALPVPDRGHDQLGQLVERPWLRDDEAGLREILRRPPALHIRGPAGGASRIPLSLRGDPRAAGGDLLRRAAVLQDHPHVLQRARQHAEEEVSGMEAATTDRNSSSCSGPGSTAP